jgi:hypothetical protein
MTRTRSAEGKFSSEGEIPRTEFFGYSAAPSGIFRELDGDPILLGTGDAGRFYSRYGVENPPTQCDRLSRQRDRGGNPRADQVSSIRSREGPTADDKRLYDP